MIKIDCLTESDRKTPKTILFIGDGMQDIYIHGRLEASQDDCPKFVSDTTVTVPGGALNAYTSVEKWNAERFCQTEQETTKTRFVVNGKIVWRYDRDFLAERPFKNMTYIESLNPDAILISDYDKGFLSREMIRQIIDYASERKIPCVVDAKREPLTYRRAILKGNFEYVQKYPQCRSLDKPMVLTQGPFDPCLMCFGLPPKTTMKKKPVHCINHVGAGDCFAAHLALALAHGFSLEDAATIAHSAGRVYVQHMHNRPPWPHEIRKDIDPLRGKIIDAGTLDSLRKSTHQKIVFANGCFDLFGPHHLYYLNEAKKHGDLLVVGVNSDESVRHLKGVGRPVIPQEQRAMLIAGLESVDWVVVFDDQTPEKIMESLSPDVRAVVDLKMEGRCINGDEFAKQIVSIKPMSGWSTTHTMTKIQNSPR